MNINHQSLDAFREDVKKALEGLEIKYDVVIKPGNCTYDPESFNLTLKVSNKDAGKHRFQRYVDMGYGIYDNMYGRDFVYKGRTYTVIDVTTSKKFDIVCRRDDGEIYNFRCTDVKNWLT